MAMCLKSLRGGESSKGFPAARDRRGRKGGRRKNKEMKDRAATDGAIERKPAHKENTSVEPFVCRSQAGFREPVICYKSVYIYCPFLRSDSTHHAVHVLKYDN
jgi:hypothetical protein